MWRARPKRLERIGVARQGMARMHFFAATGATILAYSGHPQRGRAIRSAAEFQQGGL
jgi:hypothetical protein